MYLQQEVFPDWKNSVTIGCIIKCIDCCLWYIEKVVALISKNAFIVCAIKNYNFCHSAERAIELLVGNAARVSILLSLSCVACFILKIFIVGCTMVVAWGLINVSALTQNKPIESGLFPMCGILILSFIIASLFLNVYEACVDAIMLCFLVDEDEYNGEFMDEELAELVGMYEGAEKARMEYEKQLREASSKSRETKSEPKAEPKS